MEQVSELQARISHDLKEKGSLYLFSKHFHMSNTSSAVSFKYQTKLYWNGRYVNLWPVRRKASHQTTAFTD